MNMARNTLALRARSFINRVARPERAWRTAKFSLSPRHALSGRATLLHLLLAVAAIAPAGILSAAPLDPAVVPLLKRSFFFGREYFVLRSGRVQMIVQADKADLAPAFMYLLFDAQDSKQNKFKDRALNFADGQGMANSALEVVLGGFPFTALGHETQTRWTTVAGIPTVEAVWWAGGLRVTERIYALTDENAFVRRIELSSVNLAGPEKVTLRLSLPPGLWSPCDRGLRKQNGPVCLDVAQDGKHRMRGRPSFTFSPETATRRHR